MNKYFSLLLVLLHFVCACQNRQNKEGNAYDQDAKEINYELIRFNNKSNIDSLIDFGLYNLAFESILNNSNKIDDSIKFNLASQFIENGEFDKGLAIANTTNQKRQHFEIIALQLQCALKKQDIELSKSLLDRISHETSAKINPKIEVDIALFSAYHAHNAKQYDSSITGNEKALVSIQHLGLSNEYLAKVYRRLGNDYNDIVRDKIPYKRSREFCFRKGIDYYNKERYILLKSIHQNQTKIALNYFTTAMLYNAYNKQEDVTQWYHKALTSLIVANQNGFIVSRNPIYTSIVLTQLGSIYFEQEKKDAMDSLYQLNKQLIDIRSFYKINNKQSLDVWEYFPQVSEERKILYELLHKNDSVTCAMKVLEMSSNCKYPNQFINRQLQQTFGSNSNTAIKNWILLNELQTYGAQSQNEKISQFAKQKLQKYTAAIAAIIQQKKIEINKNTIDTLQQWCAHNEASIVDYQILYGGSIAMIIIDPSGIQCQWINNKEQLNKNKILELNNNIRDNNITAFQNIAPQIYQHLLISKITSKRIIICPDEFLEKIPFDALIAENHQHKQWSALDFIGKKQRIQFIPNLSSLLHKNNAAYPLQIDLWSSDKDNETLPYNQHLIQTLEQQYHLSKNNAAPQNILHVLGHTYRTTENNIEFRLNKDTLSINSNGTVSPKLAILEGCSSGDGKIVKFEGSISQTRCFLYNGTPAVIFSHWDADNQSSTALFKHFYTFLDQGLSTSNALNSAKNQLINDHLHPEWANPFYWANFQLTGQDLSFVH